MLAAIQALPHPGDKTGNLRAVAHHASLAAARGARIAVFPELFTTGYNIGQDLHDLAEPLDGASVATLSGIARQHRIALVVGLAERQSDGVYNSAVVLDETGKLCGVYRKTHLFGPKEAALFRPGDSLCVVQAAGLRIGVAICYDVEFPELARALVRGGAQILCVPTANMEPYREVPTTLVRARALENGVPVIYANLWGQEGDLTYTGLSGIVAADGTDLARAGTTGEALLVADEARAIMGTGASSLSSQALDLRRNVLDRLSAGL
jgi:5-aminopentanamidase